MQANLMAGVSHGLHVFWERVEAVPWNEPSGLDVIFAKELKQPLCANGASKYALIKSKFKVLSERLHLSFELSHAYGTYLDLYRLLSPLRHKSQASPQQRRRELHSLQALAFFPLQ